jgi:hypothetical protein
MKDHNLEDPNHIGCNIMQFGTNAVFRLLPPGFLLKLHFHPED